MDIPCCPHCKKLYFLDGDEVVTPPRCEHLVAWRINNQSLWEITNVTDPAIFEDESALLPPIMGKQLDQENKTDALIQVAYDGVFDLVGSIEGLLGAAIFPEKLLENSTATSIITDQIDEDSDEARWARHAEKLATSETTEYFSPNALAVRETLLSALNRAHELRQ